MSKLLTEWDLMNNIWHIIQQQVEEEILLSSDVQDEIEKHIESHTAAHTAELQERVKELEERYNRLNANYVELIGENTRLREALEEAKASVNTVREAGRKVLAG